MESTSATQAILIVDDDLGIRETLAVGLRHAGYDVDTACTVAGALAALKTRETRLVFCDLRLPDGDGLQILDRANASSRQISFVIMTGYGTIASAVKAMRLGARDYVEKPLDVDVVIGLAARYVHGREVLPPVARGHLENDTALARGNDSNATDLIAPRATRIAKILTGPLIAQEDVRSIAELCRVAPVGVSGGTFRRICREERIHARQGLQFARLLRALALANQHAASPSEWMDVDPRTFHSLLTQAGITLSGARNGMPLQDFIRQQQLVCNPLVLRAVERACEVVSPNDKGGRDR
jgi:ActR/RegA family two-component response regulator